MKIIQAREVGLSFGQLDTLGVRHACDKIIIRGAAIYGCDTPQTDLLAETLSDEIYKYLINFGYEDYTMEEIMLALSINADGNFKNPLGEDVPQVPFFGNFIHVAFIAKVLKGYSVLRNSLESKFKNHIDGY